MAKIWRLFLWTGLFYVIATYLWWVPFLITAEGRVIMCAGLYAGIAVAPVSVPSLLLFELFSDLLTLLVTGKSFDATTLKHWSIFIGILALVQGIGHILLWLRYRRSARSR